MTNTPVPAEASQTLRTPRERLAQVVAYVRYGYVFHLVFDWLRPLASGDDAAMAMGARASRNGVATAR